MRGHSEQWTASDDSVTVVGWHDNRSVYVASNAVGSEPTKQVQRWSRAERKRKMIPQPQLISQYNMYMGGVDRADQNISSYRISIRSKKWWWPLFVWVPDMIMQNAWILYRLNKEPDDENLDLLSFRRSVVQIYLQKYKIQRVAAAPQRNLSFEKRVPSAIREDQVGHYQSPFTTNKRCGLCRKNTRKGCKKCGVGLHDKCFEQWHGIRSA